MFFQVVLLVAFGCLLGLLLLVLFEPGLPYRVVDARLRHDDPDFLQLLGVLVDAAVQRASTATVLTNGAEFYEGELAAIGEAHRSVHVEAFIFHPSPVADRFLAVLEACARRGVAVRVVVDAIGSFPTPNAYFDRLREAGGHVAWYQPIRWFTLKRFNNRSHRELIVVDGAIGFIGGAGIARHWSEPAGGQPPWRDTMVRVTGSVVNGLQSAFLENWLEATGEILAGNDICCAEPAPLAGVPALVVTGTPSPARASRARVLFQILLATARETIEINSPYFLPDRSARRELVAAAKRNVRVRIIVPGRYNNHPSTRLASRRRYGALLEAGVEIFEYRPGMIHAKIMIVDRRWAAVGSTNFDSRSFDLNDEVNLAVLDAATAGRLASDFENDLGRSQRVTLDDWRRRSLLERMAAAANVVFERQE
jgi:cardiolipin synthase